MPAPSHAAAFAPGRVNIIGEHTDYNGGLALPFAIDAGVTVRASALGAGTGARVVQAFAADLDETDEFPLDDPPAADGWRAFVRGAVAELDARGLRLPALELKIAGSVPQGSGLSSSAAVSVSLCLALLALGTDPDAGGSVELDGLGLARLCSRIEHRWAGASTGLLDQLASLEGATDSALLIDFAALSVEHVPLALGGFSLVVLDSGERHVLGSSGYNERREECARAGELLAAATLSEADPVAAAALPEPLCKRAEHVLGENRRVREAVAALQRGALGRLGELLDESHRSLRDLYEVSTPAVEATRKRLIAAGAAGARIVGGGFGGSVLALMPPGVAAPAGSLAVSPGPGAHLLDE